MLLGSVRKESQHVTPADTSTSCQWCDLSSKTHFSLKAYSEQKGLRQWFLFGLVKFLLLLKQSTLNVGAWHNTNLLSYSSGQLEIQNQLHCTNDKMSAALVPSGGPEKRIWGEELLSSAPRIHLYSLVCDSFLHLHSISLQSLLPSSRHLWLWLLQCPFYKDVVFILDPPC